MIALVKPTDLCIRILNENKKRNYYLAIDIGASSGRHVLGWSKNGILQTQEIYRFSNAPQMDGEYLKWNTSD